MYSKESFTNKLNFNTGELSIYGSHNKVYLADIKHLFKDRKEANRRLEENPLIYETFYPDIEPNEM